MKLSLQRVWAIVIRHLFTWRRELESLAESFWWPSFDLFIWGLTTIYLQNRGVPSIFTSMILGAIIFWMFVYRSQQEMGISFLRDVWDRNLLNLLTSPLTIWEFMAALLTLGIIKLIISTVWMTFLAYLLFSFNIFRLGFVLIPFVINLLIFGWSAGFVINGLIMKYGYRIQAFAWTLILIIQPFSAVFYPIAAMPAWMQAVSRFLPSSYIFEGMREVFMKGQIDTATLATAGGLNLVYLILSLLYFNKCFGDARESGMIVKFS